MVSALRGLRRRARLEYGTVPRPGRVLPRVRQHRFRDHGAAGIHRRRDRTAHESARGADGNRARATRAGAAHTWRFSANNVRDVAWAAAPNFIWDASGWNGILLQSFYPPAADSVWRESTRIVRHSIRHYSEKWFPYPYPTAINVNGPVAGMEYPMIVFCASRRGTRGLFGVTTHELGHQWFPMIVGSNERLYAWLA